MVATSGEGASPPNAGKSETTVAGLRPATGSARRRTWHGGTWKPQTPDAGGITINNFSRQQVRISAGYGAARPEGISRLRLVSPPVATPGQTMGLTAHCPLTDAPATRMSCKIQCPARGDSRNECAWSSTPIGPRYTPPPPWPDRLPSYTSLRHVSRPAQKSLRLRMMARGWRSP